MKPNGYSRLPDELQSLPRRKRIIFISLVTAAIYVLIVLDIITIKFNIHRKDYVDSELETPGKIYSETIASRLRSSELLWKESVRRRHEIIGQRNLSEINPWDLKRFVVWWDYFYTSFNCPHQLERIGKVGDGGKWVCGLHLYEQYPRPNCVIYSFGVSSESSFEAEIHDRTDCEIFAYDFSVTKMGPQMGESPRVHFKSIGLADENSGKFRTLDSLMEQNGHTWIDILKIDIEESEYAVLDQIAKTFETLPFGQLQIELHIMKIKFSKFYGWWEMLESKGLRAITSEINMYAAIGNKQKMLWVEYTFINSRGNHLLLQ